MKYRILCVGRIGCGSFSRRYSARAVAAAANAEEKDDFFYLRRAALHRGPPSKGVRISQILRRMPRRWRFFGLWEREGEFQEMTDPRGWENLLSQMGR